MCPEIDHDDDMYTRYPTGWNAVLHESLYATIVFAMGGITTMLIFWMLTAP